MATNVVMFNTIPTSNVTATALTIARCEYELLPGGAGVVVCGSIGVSDPTGRFYGWTQSATLDVPAVAVFSHYDLQEVVLTVYYPLEAEPTATKISASATVEPGSN